MSASRPLFAPSVLEDRKERIERFVAALQSRQPRPRSRPPPVPEVVPVPRPAAAIPVGRADPSRRSLSEDIRDSVRCGERKSEPGARPAPRHRSPIVAAPCEHRSSAVRTSPAEERRERLRRIHLETERRVRDLRRRAEEEEAGRRAEREAAEMEDPPMPPASRPARAVDRSQASWARQRPCEDEGNAGRAERHRARSLLVLRGFAPWKRLVEMSRCWHKCLSSQ